MKKIAASSASEAAAAWWMYSLYNVRRLHDESISQGILRGDLHPIHDQNLKTFKDFLKYELDQTIQDLGRCTLEVGDGRPDALLARVAAEAGISIIYLRLLEQTMMRVYAHKVEVNGFGSGDFQEIWSDVEHAMAVCG